MDDRIDKLDQLFLEDLSLGPSVFAELRQAQQELGLVFGDRPTCPFLRPYILSRRQYQEVKFAAETVAHAFEKVANEALANRQVLDLLCVTPAEEEMARIDPGYERLCVTSRLDSYVTAEGFHFLEYNAESPAGVGDQMQLEKVLFSLPAMRSFLERHPHWLPQPHQSLLDSLLRAYRQWGGEAEQPRIAIVDWRGVPTGSEFKILQEYFVACGYPSVIADPADLTYDGDRLSVDGLPIDILYKRVVIHEFLNRSDREHPLARAYRAGRVFMANSFRSKLVHKKAGLAVLSDPRFEYLFDPIQREVIGKHVPWTRLVQPSVTSFRGVEQDLLSLVRQNREEFVLKPNDDYGGHGVFLGWETSAEDWDLALRRAIERPYVVQERVAGEKINMPAYSDRVSLDAMYVDFDPFLFHNEVEGALVRLSASALLNVTAGGGQTALLVLED
ncbi:MAG TPA: circularly permuted type 2 ATP-grasp protein [Pyrinomonadaceae bacterium]|nr:circularly permuted type 2 ATP-grasp protein [Pyrinomonadaceae bacterium]